MARTRVTSRRTTGSDTHGEYLGFCARYHYEFVTDAPRDACAEATAAQHALQRRCAAAAAAAPSEPQPVAGLGALNREPDVLLRLLAAFPPDERARLALVHRSWAAFLARPECWQVLDLAPAGGGARAAVCDRLLRGAAARACGTLHTLDVSDGLWRLCIEDRYPEGPPADRDEDDGELGDDALALTDEALRRRRFISTAALLSVLAANSASLRVLRALCTHELCDAPVAAGLRPPQLLAALAAAPALTAMHADVACMPAQAPALLRGEGPYGPLRVRRLVLCGQYRENESDDPAARPGGDDHTLDPGLAAHLAAHAPLCELELDRMHLAPDDVAEAAAALAACRNVRALWAHGADGHASEHGYGRQAPALPADTALAALLPPLRQLSLQLQPLDAGEASRLARQLRAAPLQALSLTWPGADRTAWPATVWVPHEAPDAATALAAGLAEHPTLLRLWLRDFPLQPAPGGAITAPALLRTLTAHASALEALHLSGGRVTDDDDDEQRAANEEHAAEFLGALAAASTGAPALRHLSVPWAGLGGLAADEARAAAPALRTLTLLMGDDVGVKHHNAEYFRRGRGAVRRWLPRHDLLNDPPFAKPASDEDE
jgi:hypothetical protein